MLAQHVSHAIQQQASADGTPQTNYRKTEMSTEFNEREPTGILRNSQLDVRLICVSSTVNRVF